MPMLCYVGDGRSYRSHQLSADPAVLAKFKKMLAPHGKASLLLLLQEGSVPEVPDVADQSEATEEDVDAELEALAQVCYSIAAVVCF